MTTTTYDTVTGQTGDGAGGAVPVLPPWAGPESVSDRDLLDTTVQLQCA